MNSIQAQKKQNDDDIKLKKKLNDLDDSSTKYVMSCGLLKHDVASIVAEKSAEFLDQSNLIKIQKELLEQAKMVAPILFAKKGDHFGHFTENPGGEHETRHDFDAEFVYLGRTNGEQINDVSMGKTEAYLDEHMRKRNTEYDGKPISNVIPKGWLRFQYILHENDSATTCADRRELMWPQGEYYEFDKNGLCDANIFCLPISECQGFTRCEPGS